MEQKVTLNGSWSFKEAEGEEIYNGTVPGSVLSDLLALGLTEDPYWRTNEYGAKELFRKDYVYFRQFPLQKACFEADEILLVLEGLDTIADIYLNGELLSCVNDMHRTYRFPVKDRLKEENEISIRLHSPLEFIEKADREGDIFYASTGCQRGNGALRKAHYMFGWDWGPQIPDAGIFRDVYLLCSSVARLENLRIRQFHETDFVKLSVEPEITRLAIGTLELQYEVEGPDKTVLFSDTGILEAGQQQEPYTVCLKEPKLWWPCGYGEQPLYTVNVKILAEGKVLSQIKKRIGLRSITVCTDPDPWGSQFAFVVNGQKIFAMGANYIPEDNIRGRMTKERSERLVKDCARANFNCIRIWGGGFYPDDDLYDACDEEGILVWQDLMFACNVYDLTDEFEENILAETADNVRRLRHHACLALWCGNNEMEWGWSEWGRLEGHRPKYKADYIKIFEMLLPRITREHDDQTYYWLSSPSSGGSFDGPNDFNRGDNHYWEVWHSNKPFTEYRDSYFRFCSEFGFQSFPGKKTLDSFGLPADQNIFGEVMESHQKNGLANTKIFSYVSGYYKYPKDMENIAYISQILQLKAIQYGVEHWRRNWGRCMGSIYWQLNDCWPAASWASLDYYGRWKALHYGARRFYSRFMVSACEKTELSPEIDYYIHNESFQTRKALLRVRLFDRENNTIHTMEKMVEAGPFETAMVMSVDFSDQMDGVRRKQTGAEYELMEDKAVVSRGTNLFVKPKYFEFLVPEYQIAVTEEEDCFRIHVSSHVYASYVELYMERFDPVFEDNYFDITSPKGVYVTVKKAELEDGMTAEELKQELHIRSVADSF